MIGRYLRQHQHEELAQRKRIGRTPRNRALGVPAFELADQHCGNDLIGKLWRISPVDRL
jgi:hypothetical protein